MRILGVHNRYQIRGGEEECYEAEVDLLRQHGHHVDLYEETNDSIAQSSKLTLAAQTVWSQKTYQTIRRRLAQNHYDIVHVQNFFPIISPSIYYAAKSEGVPVVQTLHNYRLICPNGLFFRQGKICESCIDKPIPYPGVVHRCYRENRIASAGVAAMLSVHRTMHTWQHQVDCYITLTEFARQKFIEGGLPANKIVVKPNFVAPEPNVGKGKGGYALYVGRLSVEKGLDTLLDAWKQLKNPFPLKIVGDGPLSTLVTEATQQQPHIKWLGRRPMTEVHQLMGEAQFLIFPSKWYETFGRVAIEAFATGTPVIASNIGAIAELVEPGYTGWHFRPGNVEDLAEKVNRALDYPAELTQMRCKARAKFEKCYTAAQNYQQLIDIYKKVQTPYLAKKS